VLIVALIGVALSRRLPRTSTPITIARPASEVFVVLNGHHRFNDWSPGRERIPTQYTVSGPAAGVGAKSWIEIRRRSARAARNHREQGQRIGETALDSVMGKANARSTWLRTNSPR
jgi:hypothetical protein